MAWHDAQYLFRLTSTFGWDDVESLCNELISGIQHAAERERYSTDRGVFINQLNDSLRNDEQSHSSDKRSAEDWLRHATEQLYYQDQWLNTPLHGKKLISIALFFIYNSDDDIDNYFYDSNSS